MLTVSLETGLSSIREMDASTAGTWRTGELMFPRGNTEDPLCWNETEIRQGNCH